MISQMFYIIFNLNHIFTYLKRIFYFFTIITTFLPRFIYTLIAFHFHFSKSYFLIIYLKKYISSQSTNTSVINFCDVCNLSFESKKALYRHQSYDLKHKELLEKRFESEEEEISERVYNLDEDDYIIKTKPATKPKTKTEEDIYTRMRYECKECHEEFRSKVALTTHSYSHNRMYLEKTEDFDINSSQNMREFYITDKGGNYIEDIDEATNYSLEEIKNRYQFHKVKSFKYKITAECDYKKRTKEEVKTTKIFFNSDYINNNAIYDYSDFNRWLDFEKEIYEGYGYDFEFLGIRSVQLNIEPTKASLGSF